MCRQVEPIDRWVFETPELMANHTPVWLHPNKQVVFDISSPGGCTHEGQLVYSRWSSRPLPDKANLAAAIRILEGREDVYDYIPSLWIADAVDWHVNFADPQLFVAYGSSLLAQDEMQAAEHPVLGALREALDAEESIAVTVENGEPTPVTVTGIERRCRIATDRNVTEGRPNGLYGNAFASANESAIRQATTAIIPPTITNLIAIAAPMGGYGNYQASQVRYVLDTAVTGFRAATDESVRLTGIKCPVVVHSGFWGCGAFGGNRVMMALLQMIAAEMAGLERLVMHTFDSDGTKALDEATRVIRTELDGKSLIQTDQLIDRIVGLGFEWGIEDGT